MDSDRQPPSLVGRTRELGAIDLALDRVSSGAQWAIEVVGEPGIGKSRLVAEVCRRASERGFLVLDGRAAEFEQDIPFGVFIDALNDSVGSLGPTTIRALDADAVEELSSILPSMSALGDERVVGGGDARRYRVHYAIRALLERLAKSQPLLLALDDVHWADAVSFEVIAHLLRRFRGRLLIALAFRHAPAHLIAALEATARAGSGSRLELAPLTRDEARALLGPELDARDREAVYLESGGNPFYLEQLARDRARQPSSSSLVTGDGWVVPPSVIAAIEHELDLLRPDCRVALDAAAVAGESFDPGLVAAIAERDERAALAALDELLAADLIRSTAVPQRFRFRHPIVRRVVYDAMPAGWRLGAHARAATALAVVHASKAERAHHVARSATLGDEQAIALLVEAARDAALRAPLTGGRLVLAAVRLIPGDADGRRVRLLGDAGALLTSGGGYSEALEALEEALSLASSGAVGVRGDLIAKLAEARRRGGRPFASRADLEHTMESLTGADGSTALAVRLELAMDRYWHGDFERVRELAAEVLEVAREQHDQLLVCLAASLRSLAFSYECEIEAALAELQEAQAAFAALPDERLAERIYLTHYISEAALRLERADDALAHFRRGLEVARMTGQDATSRSWHGIAVYAADAEGSFAGCGKRRRGRHRPGCAVRGRLAHELAALGGLARRILARPHRSRARKREGGAHAIRASACGDRHATPRGGRACRRPFRLRRSGELPRRASRSRCRREPMAAGLELRARLGPAGPRAAGSRRARRRRRRGRARRDARGGAVTAIRGCSMGVGRCHARCRRCRRGDFGSS